MAEEHAYFVRVSALRQTEVCATKFMLDKLAQIETRYQELTDELSSAELFSNPSAYGKAAKQHRSLREIVEKYRALKSLQEEIAGARDLFENAADEEMRELARGEIEAL